MKNINKKKNASEEAEFGKKVKDAVAGNKIENVVASKIKIVAMGTIAKKSGGKVLESYSIKSDGNMDVSVHIKKKGTLIIYDLEIPEIDAASLTPG